MDITAVSRGRQAGERTRGLFQVSAFGYPLAPLGPRNKFLGGYDMPGDAPVHLDTSWAEAKAETPVYLGFGMSAGTRKIRVRRYQVADRRFRLAADFK